MMCHNCKENFHACSSPYCCARSCDKEEFEWDFCNWECVLAYREKFLPAFLKKHGLTKLQLEEILNDARLFYLDEG